MVVPGQKGKGGPLGENGREGIEGSPQTLPVAVAGVSLACLVRLQGLPEHGAEVGFVATPSQADAGPQQGRIDGAFRGGMGGTFQGTQKWPIPF